jgi:hypothetical protein
MILSSLSITTATLAVKLNPLEKLALICGRTISSSTFKKTDDFR